MTLNKFTILQLGALFFLAGGHVQASTNLIPNGGFQMYKPGDPSVTADFPAGNNFAGTFTGVVTASGTVIFSDASGGQDIVMPGWEVSPNGGGEAGLFNRGVGRGLDNNTTVETFAGWGGSVGQLVRSDSSLGAVGLAGYTLTADVNGASSGDPSAILTDLRLDLLANGVVITPSTMGGLGTGNDVWYTMTQTYDSAALAAFAGQALTVEFGTNPTNTAGGRASWDNISLVAVPEPSAMSLLLLGGLAALRRKRR
ncbi:MAG: hypothetical protein ACI9NC_003620 [Verrucomicrobiales bacterium]|jgi:hypothetical protein